MAKDTDYPHSTAYIFYPYPFFKVKFKSEVLIDASSDNSSSNIVFILSEHLPATSAICVIHSGSYVCGDSRMETQAMRGHWVF